MLQPWFRDLQEPVETATSKPVSIPPPTAFLSTGDRYVETSAENASDYMSSTVMPSEFTHTETLVLNRIGEDGTVTKDDYLLRAEAHGTVSTSGVATLKSLEFKPECR